MQLEKEQKQKKKPRDRERENGLIHLGAKSSRLTQDSLPLLSLQLGYLSKIQV